MPRRWMTWGLAFLLAFSLLAGALVLIPESTRADPILPDYAYKVRITVAAHGPGALADCQMALQIFQGVTANSAGVIYLQNHALNWPHDLRFTDDSGMLLSYWRESDSDGALYWVKLPTIAAGSTTDYWLYYGYASATDVSNGTNTFIMFDDFLGGTLDSAIWDSTGTPAVGGGVMDIYADADGIYSKTAFNSSCAIRTKIDLQSGSTGAAGFVGFGTGQRGYTFDIYGGYPVPNNINAVSAGGGFSLGRTGASPHVCDIYRHGTEAGIWDDDTYKATLTEGSSASLYVHASADGASSPHLSLDWIAVRLSDADLPGWDSSGTEQANEEETPVWAPTLNSITPYGSSNSSYANWVVGDDFDTRLIYNESCDYLLYTDAPFLSAGGDNGTDTFDVVNVPALAEGSYYAHVEATSNAGTLPLWTNWTFDVWPMLSWAPAFISTPDLTGQVGTSYSYEPECNESVTYSLETKPEWAIMDDGEISGTPLLPGDYDFELKAMSNEGGLDAWQNWTVTVPDPVIPPVTVPFSDITNLLAELLTILLMVVILVAITTILNGIRRW